MDILDKLAVVGVNSDLLGIVDIVDDEVAIGTCNDADVVAYAGGTRLEVAEHTVAEYEGDGVGEIHARRTLHTLALDVDDVGREEHPDEVEGIDAEVEQGTATEVGTHDARFLAHRVAEGGCEQTGCADTAAADEIAHDGDGGLITCPDGFCEEDLTLTGEIDDLLCLFPVRHEGFLHEAGFVCQEGLARDVVVMGVGRRHIDEIHIGISDELGVRAVGFTDVPFGRKGVGLFLRTGGDGITLTGGEAVEGDGCFFGNPTCTDDTDAQFQVVSHIQLVLMLSVEHDGPSVALAIFAK